MAKGVNIYLFNIYINYGEIASRSDRPGAQEGPQGD